MKGGPKFGKSVFDGSSSGGGERKEGRKEEYDERYLTLPGL